MIERIEPMGMLVGDCSLAGEGKADQRFPAHGNVLQLSRDRWLVMFSSRGYRFGDDECSVIYQLRRDRPDGPVVKEGWLSRAAMGWDPLNEGRNYFKQHGCVTAFGVPRGAVLAGRPAAHSNVFVAKWRVVGLDLAQPGKWEGWAGKWPFRDERTQAVEWAQFRLNDREDDIEVLQPPALLCQLGHTSWSAIATSADGRSLAHMNQAFVPAVPLNDDCTQWGDVNHFLNGQLAALRYTFNSRIGLYEWTDTGPVITSGTPDVGLMEASLLRHQGQWLIMARKNVSKEAAERMAQQSAADGPWVAAGAAGTVWFRSEDPFRAVSAPAFPTAPNCFNVPMTAFVAPDGVIRMFGGDATLAGPPRNNRCPLRCWEIDPADFSVHHQRVVFDAFDYGLPIRRSAEKAAWTPACDFGKLVPHAGGREQLITHRCHLNAAENAWAGMYYEKIVYDRDCPPAWRFA